MTFAVVTFPGSNCDRDCIFAVQAVLGFKAKSIFHKETSLGNCDAVIIPGGFSYGDYLRCGALAKFSPIMPDIVNFANSGGPVIGICNGFQILCEVGLLPGALVKNRHLKFISRVVSLRVENNQTMFTSAYSKHQEIEIPIAHGDGNYIADEKTIQNLEDNGQVILRYIGPKTLDTPDGNPNGSTNAIAGIINEKGNVFGMMPHPERATDPQITKGNGADVFRSMADAIHASKKILSVA